MLIELRCDRCGSKMSAPANARGTTRKCPGCQFPVTLPDVEPPSSVKIRRDWLIWGLGSAAVVMLALMIWAGAPRQFRPDDKEPATIARKTKSPAIVVEAPDTESAGARAPAPPTRKRKSGDRPSDPVGERSPKRVAGRSQSPARHVVVAPPRRSPANVTGAQPQHSAISRPTARVAWPALKRFNANVRWALPQLDDDNYRKWIAFLRPTADDLKWRKIRWHKSLSVAAAEARRLQRPILLWTMNGHPCGET